MVLKVEDVVCPFCGCLCDDIVVYVENNEIKEVEIRESDEEEKE